MNTFLTWLQARLGSLRLTPLFTGYTSRSKLIEILPHFSGRWTLCIFLRGRQGMELGRIRKINPNGWIIRSYHHCNISCKLEAGGGR